MTQANEVVEVAEIVEVFVWVFNCNGADLRIGEEVRHHCVVEVGAMTEGLVWWEDEELGYTFATGELVDQFGVVHRKDIQ